MPRITRNRMLLLKKKLNTMRHLVNIKNGAILLVLLMTFNSIGINAAPISDISENGNINPTIDLNVTPAKKAVDIVIVTDYTGTKLAALNTQINALKAQFSTVNVDPVFHIVSSIKKVGTQNDKLLEAYRYATYNYQVHYLEVYTPGTSWNYYYNKWQSDQVLWEQTQVLASRINELPKRNPQNISISRGDLVYKYRSNGQLWEINYPVKINCTNDIKSSTETMYITKRYYSDTSEHEFDYIMSENATIDSAWTVSSYSQDVSYDVYSLDFDKLAALPLRSGSDRHMIFLSDASAKDYSQPLGNYFSFGDMTNTVENYIKTNKFSLYGVAPDQARYSTLLMDKVVKILPLGNTTLFKMENGKTLMPFTYGGYKAHIDSPVNADDIKDAIAIGSNSYMLLKTGSIKYYDGDDSQIKSIAGITNATKIYSKSQYLYILDSNGKVYAYSKSNGLEAFNNSVAISDICDASYNFNIFIATNGDPYVETEAYNTSIRVTSKQQLVRAQIKNGATVRNMAAIKDAEYFTSTAKRNALNPTLIHYASGQIQQFEGIAPTYTVSGNLEIKTPYLIENTAVSLLETNVKSIDSNGNCIFIFKNDGTIKMLNTDWIIDTYTNSRDDEVSYDKPVLKNSLVNVPLSNIQQTYRTDMERYFFVDSSNNTYMYAGGWKAPAPVLGSTLKSMGNTINKVLSRVSDSSDGYLYLIYNDGTIGQLTSKYYNYIADGFYKWLQYTALTMLPVSDIKDVYAFSSQEYILNNNSRVYHKVSGSYVEYFTNSLIIDETKLYKSLLDIFNQVTDATFYAAGAYTTAFTDIYNRYSSNSSGNMYVLLGDAMKYETAYDDYEKDPEYSRKWAIAHDPTYFDNSMGLSAYHNPTGTNINPPTILDKIGKYLLNLYARDNPKNDTRFDNYRLWSLGNHNLTVYVHRKPIAMLKASVTDNGNGTYTIKALDAGSYDLDHSLSRADKGIAAREWRWRDVTSTIWNTGQMNKADCDPDRSYIIQLRVKDLEGAWSDYVAVTIDRKQPPRALFIIDKTLIKVTDPLKVLDQSFSQGFGTITKWHWVVKKLNSDGSEPTANLQNAQFSTSNAGTGTLAGFDANVKTSYSANGVGTYRIYLRVKDSNGLWSDGGTDAVTPVDLSKYYSLDFKVDSPPVASFTVDKSAIEPIEVLKVKDTSTATGISPLVTWHWIVKKLNSDGSVPSTNVQNTLFNNRNSGTGGYDVNVKSLYSDTGIGKYRIYLRVENGNGMWSDGGTDSTYTLGSFATRDIEVLNPNLPPTVTLTKSPSFVYEGDDVTINITPTDPDNDPLDIVLYESQDNVNFTQVYALNDSPAGTVRSYTKNDVTLGAYYYRVTATDPDGEVAQATLNFTANELSVTGQVNHTILWNEHRIDYNNSKTGSSDSPRAYSVFFPGEKFVLHANTTEINPQSTVTCNRVNVKISGTSFNTDTTKNGTTTWDGSLWDAIMEKWGDQNLTFVFTAYYSNGITKTCNVVVSIGDDYYWRLHMKD